jgi:TonB family protein
MVAFLACAALAGCGSEVAQPAAAPTGNEALSAEQSPMTKDAAQKIVESGDPALVRAASARLVAQAQWFTSPAWRDAHRAQVIAAERQAGRTPTPAQVELETDHHRDALLRREMLAMEIVGGPDVVAYCLWLGENESAPVSLRKAALRVLVRHADRNDPTVRARAQVIWEKVAAWDAQHPVGSVNVGGSTASGGVVANAGQVVAGIQKGFRHCYNKGLSEDSKMSGSIRVTAKIDPSGAVASVTESHSGLSDAVAACVVERVRAARFAPPEGGYATVVIPVTFTTR